MNNRVLKITKKLYGIVQKRHDSKKIVFILGNQRSGTSLLRILFDNDFKTKVFKERGELTLKDKTTNIRLDPLEEVNFKIKQEKAPLIVLKPLVESQNGNELLEFFNNSKAIWIFRNYNAVAESNLKRFGLNNGIKNLTPIYNNDSNNWRSEKVSSSIRDIVKRYFADDMNPFDAAALFWYVRNKIFFDQKFDTNNRVLLLDYKFLISNPKKSMNKIYSFLEMKYPGDRITKIIHDNALDRGKNIQLSPEIKELCEGLQQNLENKFKSQWNIDD